MVALVTLEVTAVILSQGKFFKWMKPRMVYINEECWVEFHNPDSLSLNLKSSL